MSRKSALLEALVLLAALAALPLRAQTGTVSGTIRDAESAAPIPGATVTLDGGTHAAFPSAGSAFVSGTRSTRTGEAGEYRFNGVEPGDYRLHVQRLGYRSATVEVTLRSPSESRLSLGLQVQPVALKPIHVSTPAAAQDSYGRRTAVGDSQEAGEERMRTERLRQRIHLASDVRSMTHADVEEGVTFGETDLFRALQRLPGVSTRDEFSAELWTRGAQWDQTRVFFDGLPLFNPVHAVGFLSAVNPDAVGAAALHPGVQPLWAGGGAAGVLDLRSRRGQGKLAGMGEVSLVSSRLALDGATEDGATSWLIAGRRTYLDVLTAVAEGVLSSDRTYRFPGNFMDLAGRVDRDVGFGTLETSALLQRDAFGYGPELRGRDILNGSASRSTSLAARTTLHARMGAMRTSHTLGFSGFGSSAPRRTDDEPVTDHGRPYDRFPDQEPSSNRVRYFSFGGEAGPARGAPEAWTLGYRLVRQEVRYAGPAPTPFAPLDPAEYALDARGALWLAAAWGERRWHPLPGVTADAGVRLEGGPAVSNGGALRVAPRLAVRFPAGPGTTVSAALGRTYQYAQAVGPAGAFAERGFRSDYLWVLAGEDTPALRADVATLGAESWLGEGWLAGATAYLRRSTGIVLPDPAPGSALGRPLWVEGTGLARGVELSARRLAGAWTGSASYTLGWSHNEAAGRRFAAAADQRHTVDLSVLARVSPRWRLGAAYTASSGLPYTRASDGEARCDSAGACAWREEPWLEGANTRRTGAFGSLDLLAEWGRSYRNFELGAYLQLRNALGRDNPGRYLGFNGTRCVESCGRGWYTPGETRVPILEPADEFVPGLPTIPVVGLRISF
ncbi:MAG: hypothetical protein AVDCRST_MAG68-3773 [uncultured Gemmatimonadetes bacterium]|uniref:TonB-dependent receptor plug domain-containing protein n=1 Tax=uncultured Gemmatimonadota bacterium TaxID=203437 RepID=A0A6J4M8D2_9BACT|nr:MAG: hypothetical protein AVDCRST_MAG68-3773 [uncultured Gemmatimonadota bacterium]